MVKKLVDYVLAASCGAFSLFLKARFAPTDTSPPAFVLPALGAVALYFVLTSIVDLPKRITWLRKKLNLTEEAPIEGYWIEDKIIKDGQRYYSIFDISYDSESEKYKVSGTAHREDGEIHADWDSVMVKFDRSKVQLSYVYLANEIGTIHKAPIHGYAWLNFFSTKPVEQGAGFFVDCHEQPFRMEIRLERIRRELIKQLIGRRTLEIGHRKTFVKKYHARQSTVGGTED